MSMANARRVFRGALTLLVLAAGAVAQADDTAAETAGANDGTPVVLVAPVTAGVDTASPLVGTVVAETVSRLGFQAEGRIEARLVRFGERVTAGEPIARLDDRDLAARVESLRSDLERTRAEARLAEQELARIRDLRASNVASRQQLDQAVSRQQTATAAVRATAARLEEAQNALDYAVLAAPFDGVVVEVLADVGDVVGPGQAVFRLAEDDDRLVEVAVPEGRLSQLPAQASVRLSADDASLPVELDSVSGAADPASRTFAARYRLESRDDARSWSIGQTATLTFAEKSPQLRVPVGALFARDSAPRVFRLVDDRVEAVEVTVHAIEADHAVIGGELSEGALVVAAGVNRLHDGQRVTARRAGELAAGAAEARP